MAEGAPSPDDASLLARFPALQRLGLRPLDRVPVVRQLAATECGAACLAMVLGYYGKSVRLEDVREVCAIGRDGASALTILKAARFFGLRGRGVKVELHDVELLPRAAVLHWEFNHFVVFCGRRGDVVEIADPALGRRTVSLSVFRRAFTGVALLLEPGESFQRQGRGEPSAWRVLERVALAPGQIPRLLTTSLLIQAFTLALPVLTGTLVDRVVPRDDVRLLAVLGIGLSATIAMHLLTSIVRGQLLLQLRTRLDAQLSLAFLEHLVSLPHAFFQRRSAGDLMLRLSSNTTIRELMTSNVLSGVIDGSLVVLYLGILVVARADFAALVVVLGVLQVAVFALSRARQRELVGRELQTQARRAGFEAEMFAGMETLKAMGIEQRAVERWSDLFVDVLNVSLTRGALTVTVDAATATLRMGAPIVVLVFGAWCVLQGGLSLGAMLGLVALAQGFLGPLSNFVVAAGQLQLLASYLERIDDVMSAEPEQDRTKVRPAPRLTGRIGVEGVSFRYGPLAPFVLEDVSVDIAAGAFVAVVGRSGSGKSTLASLLLGLHRPTAGRVTFDGCDLATLEASSLRSQVGIVMQRAHVFGMTVRQNIALADPTLPFEAIEEAARRALIHDEIMSWPMKYETLLMDAGVSISGGQRQRLTLARALATKPAILLLDEATSALDGLTEAQVQQSLAKLGCTRILIAHRLSTIVHADLILVVDRGRLVAQGTHAALLQTSPIYAELVAAQLC